MTQTLVIKKHDKVIFEAKIINIPIKEDVLIKKSIELFDDDDPCIIHQSYVAKEFAQKLLDLFGDQTQLEGKHYVDELSFLDFTDIETLSFELKG
ncbi:MAG: hypothetical protein K9L26_05220 [Candidatus Izimaplasma sp.]|nr:hypothetical protein [Candidatus Izimaplasma bacterium]